MRLVAKIDACYYGCLITYVLIVVFVIIEHHPQLRSTRLFHVCLLNGHNAILVTLDTRRIPALKTHLACIISVCGEILSELYVLLVDCILADMRKQQHQTSSYEG